MRHLLNFLHFGKRDTKNPKATDDERSNKPDPASSLIIAGEVVPRGEQPPADDAPATLDAAADSKSPSLADVVKSRHKDRWQPPDLDGPEFGGLIERRGVDTRGLMPQKYEETPDAEHRHHNTAHTVHKDHPQSEAAQDAESEASTEPTGMFLAALDNSAITLADSGLFKIADEPEDDESGESFDPYDRRS